MSDEPTPTPMPSPTPTPAPTPTPEPTPTPSPAPTPTPTPPPSPAATWRQGLTDEGLRNNEHLARYGSIDDLAKAHVETVTWARGRVPLPSADDAKGREDFIGKARPEAWESYEVAVPEGQPADRADAFKQKAHQLGLMPWQAKELADWSNAYEGDAISKQGQLAQDELMARQMELGPAGYARSNEAIANMLGAVPGFEGADADTAVRGLESAFGAGKTYDLLRALAAKTGELEKVDGDAILQRLGQMSPADAQRKIEEKGADRAFMEKVKVKGSAEQAQWREWNRLAAGA